jgi:hypothetical protein
LLFFWQLKVPLSAASENLKSSIFGLSAKNAATIAQSKRKPVKHQSNFEILNLDF